MKQYFSIILLLIVIVASCEKDGQENKSSSISIAYPENDSNITCDGCTVQIITIIENKEEADIAYILVNNQIIKSGLSDSLIAYYNPPSDWNETLNIEAHLIKSENLIDEDNINITINSTNLDPLNFNPILMDVNSQFKMMRFPVTNREFINFLNNNESIEVELAEILWTNSDADEYGNPELCEFDPDDNYEPLEWWYVNVVAEFGNEFIPVDNHSIYKNGNNIYDANADFSDKGGKIQYDCQTQKFKLPDDELIYLDHPVTGVTWVGANIFANYFGLSLPSIEQWKIAAKGDSNWVYPWGNNIDQSYANYNNNTTSEIGTYNGIGEFNLSLSAFGLYDMGGNVWEHTSTSSNGADIYFKTGGAFNSDSAQLEIGYTAYSLFNHSSNNTGFRCISDTNYPSENPSGCIDEDACNYDMFSEESEECFENDCLGVCGGDAQLQYYFEDLDGDGLGNPEVSDIQCNEPDEGWVDNNMDPDDNCQSNNFDCTGLCDGEAYIDGCGECVSGDTGNEECNEDCNGVNGGTADWDSCGVCSGGDTGNEPDADRDCYYTCANNTPISEENSCEEGYGWNINDEICTLFGAYLDDCENCVEGGTGYEENYADQGCGCDEEPAQLYCLDNTNNGCCDCGNDGDGNWDECSPELDAELICENDLNDTYINTILGCSNDNAENYYCNQEVNECIAFGTNIIPPCNFIDDGSCIIYGCSDPLAQNYWEEATECEDGDIYDCCEYAPDVDPDVFISFGTINEQTMEILIDTPDYDVGGFQFFIEGTNILSGSGGLAAEAGFAISSSGSQVLGFSFSGTVIPSGSNGILTILNYTATDTNACFYLGTGAISDGSGDELGVQFGSEPETDPDSITPDDCIELP